MTKQIIFLITLTLSSIVAKTQVLELVSYDYQLTDPNFKSDYIKNNKIKEIKITYQYKPNNERIFDKGVTNVISYNKEGFPEKSVLILRAPNLSVESLITWYIYSSQNYLRVKRTYDRSGYNSEYFEFDPAGYLTKYSKVKEQNLNQNPLLFKPGYQEVKWTESYKYEFFGKERYKRTCINDISQPYKQQVFVLNKNNLKTNIYSTFVVTTTGSDEEFKYNENGQLIEKLYFANTGNYFTESYKYEYKNNLLDKEYYFLNSKQNYERFYFYSNNGLLESDIKKLPDLNMDIAKYEYTFY